MVTQTRVNHQGRFRVRVSSSFLIVWGGMRCVTNVRAVTILHGPLSHGMRFRKEGHETHYENTCLVMAACISYIDLQGPKEVILQGSVR